MSSKAPRRPARRRLLAAVLAGVTTAALVASCTSATADQPSAVAAANSSSASAGAAAGTGLFDSSTVHTVSIDYDDAAYQAMIDTFVASGDKEWISATVTIDGTVFTNAGIKLKGNSTLQGLRS
ncbi:MAG: hypothetical protein ABWZ98_04630, partial [Nakamurella sp.]